MAGELQGIDSFDVNGDDVTEKVADACLRIMHQRQQEASDIPLPEDEDYLGGGMDLSMPPLGEPADIPVVPTLDDIRKAESAAGPAPEKQENSMPSVGSALPSDLPKLSNVMPEAMVVRHSAPGKGQTENSGDMLIGKKAIKGRLPRSEICMGKWIMWYLTVRWYLQNSENFGTTT